MEIDELEASVAQQKFNLGKKRLRFIDSRELNLAMHNVGPFQTISRAMQRVQFKPLDVEL
jgi:hypothetical protein